MNQIAFSICQTNVILDPISILKYRKQIPSHISNFHTPFPRVIKIFLLVETISPPIIVQLLIRQQTLLVFSKADSKFLFISTLQPPPMFLSLQLNQWWSFLTSDCVDDWCDWNHCIIIHRSGSEVVILPCAVISCISLSIYNVTLLLNQQKTGRITMGLKITFSFRNSNGHLERNLCRK